MTADDMAKEAEEYDRCELLDMHRGYLKNRLTLLVQVYYLLIRESSDLAQIDHEDLSFILYSDILKESQEFTKRKMVEIVLELFERGAGQTDLEWLSPIRQVFKCKKEEK